MITVRAILFNLYLYGVTAGLAVFASPTLLMPRRAVVRLMEIWAHSVKWGLRHIARIELEFRGQHYLTPELLRGGVMVASKHQSMLDTIVFNLLLKDPAIVLKRELVAIPFYGWYALKSGMLVVDRSGHASTMRRLLAQARQRIAAGRPLFIYPEGTRTAVGAPPDYKPGVAALYTQLNLTCIPVALNSGLCWGRQDWRKYPGTVVFEMLEPIPPGLDRRRFMAELQRRIEAGSDRLLAEGNAIRLGIDPANPPNDRNRSVNIGG